jgi:predicted peptidase
MKYLKSEIHISDRKNTIKIAMATFAMSVAAIFGSVDNASAKQTARTTAASISTDINYLLYTPEYYEMSEDNFPLVVWLHGGDQGGSDVSKVRESGLPSMIEQGKQFPFLIFSPQNPSDELLYPIERIKSALDEIVSSEKVDPSRIYLMGYSRGGFGAWAMAEQFPETFAAVVPIAGGGTRHYLNRTNENAAFWAFHGTNDEVIPLSDTVIMVQRLQQLNRNVHLSVLEGVNHEGVEAAALGNSELWEWLAKQQLRPVEVEK